MSKCAKPQAEGLSVHCKTLCHTQHFGVKMWFFYSILVFLKRGYVLASVWAESDQNQGDAVPRVKELLSLPSHYFSSREIWF